MQFENFVMLNFPSKVDLANGISQVEKDLGQYKKYVGANFMSATEQTKVLDQAVGQLKDSFVPNKDYKNEQKIVNQKLEEYNTKLNNNFYSIEDLRRSLREFDSKIDIKADLGEF